MNPHNLTTTRDQTSDNTRRREDNGEPPLPETFHLLVKCRDENEQRCLYEQLTTNGHDCRVLSL